MNDVTNISPDPKVTLDTAEIKRNVRGKLRLAKDYLKTNAKPLAVGVVSTVAAGVTAYHVYMLNKDVLILPKKQQRRLNQGTIDGKAQGVVYRTTTGRFWLIPALDQFDPPQFPEN